MNPGFEGRIPHFMDAIPDFKNNSMHFNVVHRKVDWQNKLKSLNSMPGFSHYAAVHSKLFYIPVDYT